MSDCSEKPAVLDDSDVVSLRDVLQTEQDLMADAVAVLGACDDSNCTYSEGYLKRQALYACLTCIPEAKTDESKRAGVCLACCLHCHDGHELVELYTKRNFRCDCGNSKFLNRHCNLFNEKDELNPLNLYNQNFSGIYCICHRPYPDPEDKVIDEMIQCILCEDWYHCRHLGVPMIDVGYAEMTCESCIQKHDFLLHYDGLTISKVVDAQTEEKVEVQIDDKPEEVVVAPAEEPISTEAEPMSTEPIEPQPEAEPTCKKPKKKSSEVTTKFWRDVTWREQLCKCEDCMKMYEDQNISFLLDPHDTVQAYEEKGKAKNLESQQSMLENETKLLNSLPRVPLMETIAAYNDLRDNLSEYLKTFAENKRVVREEDIREFFSEMAAKKKQKTSETTYFCR